jgi:hypothetical protein
VTHKGEPMDAERLARIRREVESRAGSSFIEIDEGDALALLSSLDAEKARADAAEKALRPFASLATAIDRDESARHYPDACPIGVAPHLDIGSTPTIGDCRCAAKLVSAEPAKEGESC